MENKIEWSETAQIDLFSGKPTLTVFGKMEIKGETVIECRTHENPADSIEIKEWREFAKKVKIAIGLNVSEDAVLGDVRLYQLLQSKGYALPFRDLTIDDLVEYGWIKLQS